MRTRLASLAALGGLLVFTHCSFLNSKTDEEDNPTPEMLCKRGETNACLGLASKADTEGRPADMRYFLQQACDKDGTGCDILGKVQSQAGQIIEARSSWEKGCLQNQPFSCQALGRLETTSGRTEKAVGYLRQACNLRALESCRDIARLSRDSGKPEEARNWFQTACDQGDKVSCDELVK